MEEILHQLIGRLSPLFTGSCTSQVSAQDFFHQQYVYIIFTYNYYIYLGCCPLPVTVTTRIVAFLVGDSYKPSFPTVTGRGDNPIYIHHRQTCSDFFNRFLLMVQTTRDPPAQYPLVRPPQRRALGEKLHTKD